MGKRNGKTAAGRTNRQVFDRLGKLLYQEASRTAVLNSLRGLFRTELPADAPVAFAATESIRDRDGRLEKRVSDFALAAGGREFALEFQTSDDESMGLRMFGYGYAQGERRKPAVSAGGAKAAIDFPEAAVVYLEPTRATPDAIQIELRANGAAFGTYGVRAYKLLHHSLAEMEAEKLHLLTPFYLMKHRREAKGGSPGAGRMKTLARETLAIADEIGRVLERGVIGGLIAGRDMAMLLEKTYFLYQELYGAIPEFKEGQMDFEEKFKSKVLAQMKAEKEAAVRQTALERDAKILGLFRQGYTVEQVERMLSQEGGARPGSA